MQPTEQEVPTKMQIASWAKDYEQAKEQLTIFKADLQIATQEHAHFSVIEDLKKKLKVLQDEMKSDSELMRLSDEVSTISERMKLLAELITKGLAANQLRLFDDYQGYGRFELLESAKFKKGREDDDA